jgi:hypothetical protein
MNDKGRFKRKRKGNLLLQEFPAGGYSRLLSQLKIAEVSDETDPLLTTGMFCNKVYRQPARRFTRAGLAFKDSGCLT